MHVTKMHGAHNDFVIVDARRGAADDLTAFAVWACDRRGGIGADGCIVLEPSQSADVRTINADGGEAEMCGNGIRCAARWLDERGEGERIAFETGAGVVRTQIVAREPEYCVRVAMRRPAVESIELPGLGDASLAGTGNPHVVLFRDDVDDVDLVRAAGELQRDPRFPHGTNVHVASVAGRHSLHVRHWERGVGLTQACGTGAIAAAAAAVARGDVESPVEVVVPGGRLTVELDDAGGACLAGPAVRVFDAEVETH
jgi:diaminopimelate epimerase